MNRSIILTFSVDKQPRIDESCIFECYIIEHKAQICGVCNRDCRDHCLIVNFKISDVIDNVTRPVIYARLTRQIVEDVSKLKRSVLETPDLLFLAYADLANSDISVLIAVNVDENSACRITKIQFESFYLRFLPYSNFIGIIVFFLNQESVGIQCILYSAF